MCAYFNSTSSNVFKEWILDAIDHLRRRKARPDLDRICRLVEKNHPELEYSQVETALSKLVKNGDVWKIKYKGNISYRNPNKKRKVMKRRTKTTFCLCCFGEDCVSDISIKKKPIKSIFYSCKECGEKYVASYKSTNFAEKICDDCRYKTKTDDNDIMDESQSDSSVYSSIDYSETIYWESEQNSESECTSKINENMNIENWTANDVQKFINEIGFAEAADTFKQQEIDGKSLLLLKRDDVLTGLNLPLGPALKIYNKIENIRKKT